MPSQVPQITIRTKYYDELSEISAKTPLTMNDVVNNALHHYLKNSSHKKKYLIDENEYKLFKKLEKQVKSIQKTLGN